MSMRNSSSSVRLSATSAMQQVQLPPGFDEHARLLADNVLHEALQHYCLLHGPGGGVIDQNLWKLVRERNDMCCYRSLRPTASGSPSQAPELLALGTIQGSLDDIMHGTVNLSPDTMQTESLFAQGDMLDARILAVLVPPTAAEPFRTMTVKWVLRNHRGLSQQRDYVYLESTGCVTTPEGDRLGYQIVHSLLLPSVPEFRKGSNIIRGRLSYCFLFQQRPQHAVNVFFKGCVNPQGGLKDRVAMNIGVDLIVSCQSSIQHTVMKKLLFFLDHSTQQQQFLLQQQRRHRSSAAQRATITRASSTSALEMRASEYGRGSFMQRLWSPKESRAIAICSACSRPLRAFSSKSQCRLCGQAMCSRCRVTKHMIMLRPQDMSMADKLDFCIPCMKDTTSTSAAWVAAQELHEQDPYLIPNEEGESLEMEDEQVSCRRFHSKTWAYPTRSSNLMQLNTCGDQIDPTRTSMSSTCIASDEAPDADSVVRYHRSWTAWSSKPMRAFTKSSSSVDRPSLLPTVRSFDDDEEDDDFPIIESVEDDDDLVMLADEIIVQQQQ